MTETAPPTVEVYATLPGGARWDAGLWGTDSWGSAGWVDVTPQSVSATINWGVRSPEEGVLALPDADTWAVTLHDPDRILDPGNTAATFYGDLKAGLPIRLSHRGLVVRTGVVESIGHHLANDGGYIRATTVQALLGRAVVPFGTAPLPNTLYARTRAAIAAAGLTAQVYGLPKPGLYDDPPLTPLVLTADRSVWSIIAEGAQGALQMPWIDRQGWVRFRAWDQIGDRGVTLTDVELVDLSYISADRGMYSRVEVLEATGPNYQVRAVTPPPPYGIVTHRRSVPTLNPGNWAATVLADRADATTRTVPGAIYVEDADRLESLLAIEMLERVVLDPGVSPVGAMLVMGAEVTMSGSRPGKGRWQIGLKGKPGVPPGVVGDTTPPTILGPSVLNVTSSSATIHYTTDEPATTGVEYGLTTSYGSSTPVAPSLVTDHTVNLTGLTAGSTYHYRCLAVDAAGNTTTGSDQSFATSPVSTGYLDMITTRTGVLGAWLFGDDSGGTFQDRTVTNNDGTWTGSPNLAAVSPIPGDTKTAVNLASTDVGTIPHIAGYNRANGPFGLEYWAYVTSAGDLLSTMLADSPTMLLRGNESSGTTANDSSAGGTHDGTLGATATFGAAALASTYTSMDFAGAATTSYVDVPGHADFDRGNGAFTVAMIVKRDTVGAETVLATKGTAGGVGWRLYISAGDYLALGTANTATDGGYGPIGSDTGRHFLVATYDGTTTLLYKDGVAITAGGGAMTIANTTATLRLGADHAGALRLNGQVAYAAYFPTAVSAARVSSWYAAMDVAGGGSGVDHYVMSKSDFASNGWAIKSAAGKHSLTNYAGTVNIGASAAPAAGWHHFAITRGTAVNGHVYVDGVEQTATTGAVTFSNSASNLLLTADGGLYGVAYYDREITPVEAAQSAAYAYVTPPSTTTRPIYGFGAQVTGGTGKPTVQVTNLASSGVGSLAYALSGGDRRIVFTVSGTIALPSDIVVTSSNITIDGSTAPGHGITLTGAELTFGYGNVRNIIVTDIRHRGFGPTGSNVSDCISPVVGTQGVIMARLSLSGANDETIGMWDHNSDITVQDCILGPHQPLSMAHNYAALFGEQTTRVSFHHNLIYGSTYRNPASGWADDNSPVYGTVAPTIVGDVVCNLVWDYILYGTSVYWGSRANVIKNYYQGRTADPVELTGIAKGYLSGNYSKNGHSFPASNDSRQAVTAYAVIPEEATALAAAQSVMATAGCRVGGLDQYDLDILSTINATGL